MNKYAEEKWKEKEKIGGGVACQRVSALKCRGLFACEFFNKWGAVGVCEFFNNMGAVRLSRFKNEITAEDVENFFHMWK